MVQSRLWQVNTGFDSHVLCGIASMYLSSDLIKKLEISLAAKMLEKYLWIIQFMDEFYCS